jgi:hypothetical protein
VIKMFMLLFYVLVVVPLLVILAGLIIGMSKRIAIRIVLFIALVDVLVIIGMLLPAHAAQDSTETFWNSYYAARGGYGGGTDWGAIIVNQRNTEALINEMRRQRGLPPCSIGLLGQMFGKPPC